LADDYLCSRTTRQDFARSRSTGDHEWLSRLPINSACPSEEQIIAGGKAEKATLLSQRGLYLCRQRPTLPHTFACSTIGPAGLNFRVRDGNGWIPRGKITDNLIARDARSSWESAVHPEPARMGLLLGADCQALILKDREDETSQLNRLGLAYSLLCLLPISAKLHRLFVGAQPSVLVFSLAQVLTRY
jgi:hypothetical protein